MNVQLDNIKWETYSLSQWDRLNALASVEEDLFV